MELSVSTLKDGQPWAVQLKDRGTSSTFPVNLSPGQSAVYETVVHNYGQILGWAKLEQFESHPFGGSSSAGLGEVLGQTVFRKQTIGAPGFMCSVVLGMTAFRELSVYFDNTDGKYTGMAVLTSDICSYSFCKDKAYPLKVTISALDGSMIGQRTIQQKAGTLYWMNLAQDFPESAGRRGMFIVDILTVYDTTLTAFSLQFAPNGAFTAITPFEN